MAQSINHIANTGPLPDFRNFGILLRIVLIVNGIALLAALLQVPAVRGWPAQFTENAALVEPLLILSLLVLAAVGNRLRRLPYAMAIVAILVIELGLTTALHFITSGLFFVETHSLPRWLFIVALSTGMLLGYFDLRGRALSPALSEARLQALQARIRPHFLFNSINAVLSLVRQEPQRAEAALEDLAGLFRALMADNRQLTPISREIELCRQYLDLEQLRLGERLQVEWHIENMPPDALVPLLALQPLLENAVYHGIEPAETPGVVSITIHVARDRLHVVLRNPYRLTGDHHVGNKMALANIRERLQLHFDVAAELTTQIGENTFEVRMVMPYLKAK
ncbi:MAG: histidine kinase [Burkholderiales bacterium]|jgi:two-component system sensor histidine kinase AlgZ|nr:histidine kinase [Burkholderiales bacterium]